MPGTIRTFTRIFEATTQNATSHELFVTLIQYFNEHPSFQRIASNYGTNGQGFGNSFLFSGSAGQQAFAVYRAMSSSIRYDTAIAWSFDTVYSAGTWGGSQDYGVGLMMAFHSSSAAWSGSINNNGADAFLVASKPWKSGSTVFPRGNGVNGTWATNQNAPMKPTQIALEASQLWQITVIGDDETTYAFAQTSDAAVIGDARYLWAWGTYTPLTSAYNLPLFMYGAYAVTPGADFGALASETVGNTQNGGVSYVSGAIGCRIGRLSWPLNVPRRAPRPAELLYGSVNDRSYGFPIVISSHESGHYHQLGVLSGVLAVGANAFGNLQDVSRSFVTVKIENSTNSRNLSFAIPYSGSIDYFLRGTFE